MVMITSSVDSIISCNCARLLIDEINLIGVIITTGDHRHYDSMREAHKKNGDTHSTTNVSLPQEIYILFTHRRGGP
ncbi:hypothetical protein ACHAXS_002996, partial [Conticribra weissflogii]